TLCSSTSLSDLQPPRTTLFPYTTLFRSGLLPAGDIGQVHPGADHLVDSSTQRLNRLPDGVQAIASLAVHVTGADHLTLGPGRGGAGNLDQDARSHRPAVADSLRPDPSCRNSLHPCLLCRSMQATGPTRVG